MSGPETIDVAVDGGALRVVRWGSGPRVVLAAHGITGSSVSWAAVARELGDAWAVVAPDLRGRGPSRSVAPLDRGLAQHASDLERVADAVGFEQGVLAGHSMGAYVVALAARSMASRVAGVVLVDGGLPLAVPAGSDPDAVLEATLGPALARLRETYPSEEAYLDFWRAHPAFAGENFNADVEAYARYDLVGEAPELRPSAVESAVRADGRDLLVGGAAIGEALEALRCPIVHLAAPRGLDDGPSPLQPAALVQEWAARLGSSFAAVPVPDTNHYSLVFSAHGARAVADAVRRLAPAS